MRIEARPVRRKTGRVENNSEAIRRAGLAEHGVMRYVNPLLPVSSGVCHTGHVPETFIFIEEGRVRPRKAEKGEMDLVEGAGREILIVFRDFAILRSQEAIQS